MICSFASEEKLIQSPARRFKSACRRQLVRRIQMTRFSIRLLRLAMAFGRRPRFQGKLFTVTFGNNRRMSFSATSTNFPVLATAASSACFMSSGETSTLSYEDKADDLALQKQQILTCDCLQQQENYGTEIHQ